MYVSCSGNSLGLTVLTTQPIPDTPKYNSKCLKVFQARVPTVSPSFRPRFVRALASCLDRFAASEYVYLLIGPSTVLDTIYASL